MARLSRAPRRLMLNRPRSSLLPTSIGFDIMALKPVRSCSVHPEVPIGGSQVSLLSIKPYRLFCRHLKGGFGVMPEGGRHKGAKATAGPGRVTPPPGARRRPTDRKVLLSNARSERQEFVCYGQCYVRTCV